MTHFECMGAGIRAGDVLLYVDASPVANLDAGAAEDMLLGASGSTVISFLFLCRF